jgi:hypothetical protein
MKQFEVGDKVFVNVEHGFIQLKNAPAKIVYIDQKHIFDHWTFPIQVELPNEYDENGHTMLRVSLKEISYEER